MKYQVVLFDLDGTLTDSKEGITKCVQYALKDFGIFEPDLQKLEIFVGPPLEKSFQEFYGFGDEEAWRAVEKFRERLVRVGLYENRLYPGIRELLVQLKEAGLQLAVASGKPQVHIHKVLRYFEIAEYFDVVVGSELDGTRGSKEEVVEEVLRQVKVLRQEERWQEETAEKSPRQEAEGGRQAEKRVIMVGDRKFDVEGAKAHGLPCVGVLYGCGPEGELEAAGADFLVKDVKELGRILLA